MAPAAPPPPEGTFARAVWDVRHTKYGSHDKMAEEYRKATSLPIGRQTIIRWEKGSVPRTPAYRELLLRDGVPEDLLETNEAMQLAAATGELRELLAVTLARIDEQIAQTAALRQGLELRLAQLESEVRRLRGGGPAAADESPAR